MASHLCAQVCSLPSANFNAWVKQRDYCAFLVGSSQDHKFWQKAAATSGFSEKCSATRATGKGSSSFPLLSINSTLVLEKRVGATAVQGTGRPVMEDTYSIVIGSKGSDSSFFGVFDGHGGIAVAEMLKKDFWSNYKKRLSGTDPIKSTVAAYLEFDSFTLAQPKGLFGALRERGIGGSRCGSTAATVVLLPSADGKKQLVAANVGDARVVLSRGAKAIQLSFDHKLSIKPIKVQLGTPLLIYMSLSTIPQSCRGLLSVPNVEAERKRIEAKNPTPRKPLVVNVDGTWRVGGLLALSRAFGDVYLKDWSDGKIDGARGGFGLTAEPTVMVETLGSDDDLVVLGTDGLFEQIPNQEVVDICRSARGTTPAETIAEQLVQLAQKRGVTDDITAMVVFLPQDDLP